MDAKKSGAFIAGLRREKGLTQKQLAAKLNVTDKAVSKWERGAGYPEITTVPLLAEELGVSPSEILLGRRENTGPDFHGEPERKAADVSLSETVEYMEELRRQKAARGKSIALLCMTAAFLIAAFVCCLCNYVAEGRLSWSLYVAGSEAAAWLTAAPPLKFRRHGPALSMAGLTVSVFPLLLLVERLCPVKNWAVSFAFPAAALALASLWAAVLLFRRGRRKPLFYAAFVLLLFGTADNVILHRFVNGCFSVPDVPGRDLPTALVAGSCAAAALVLLCLAGLRGRRDAGAD